MFVDASAVVALLSEEPEAERVSGALASAATRLTSPIVVLEAVLALARPDKLDLPITVADHLVRDFLSERGIEICDLPPGERAVDLAIWAADRCRPGSRGLNLGDCLHYACAKHYGVPILATADEFRATDLETVP